MGEVRSNLVARERRMLEDSVREARSALSTAQEDEEVCDLMRAT